MKIGAVHTRPRRNKNAKHSKDNTPVAEFSQAFPRETEVQAKKWAYLLGKARNVALSEEEAQQLTRSQRHRLRKQGVVVPLLERARA